VIDLDRDITMGNSTGGGFITANFVHINVIFEDLYINNFTFTGEEPFLYVNAGGTSYNDKQNDQTAIVIKNGVIKHMYEGPASTLKNTASSFNALFVQSSGPTILKVQNLSVTNSIFSSKH